MNELPKRKPIRIKNYDYSEPGAYFITVCTLDRKHIFWDESGKTQGPLQQAPLSEAGVIVRNEIEKISIVYDSVRAEKYCIMPDHVHFIISIDTDENGQAQSGPSISRVINQFKGSVTKQIGRPVWQKSFYEHLIRNKQDHKEIWEYIENNPLKYMLKRGT